MIQAFLYDAEGRDRRVELDAETVAQLAERHMLWLDAGSTDSAELASLAGLLHLSAECMVDLERAETRHALVNFGDYFVLDVSALDRSGSSETVLKPPKFTPLVFVVSQQWLLTVRRAEVEFLQKFRDQDKGETQIGALSGPSLAASLLDWHLTTYLDALEDGERYADRLDERMLAPGTLRETMLGELVSGRRFVSQLSRLIGPQRAVFYGLSRPDFTHTASSEAAPHFKALERRFDRTLDAIERGRERMRSSFELFATRTAETTNILIRRLTFLSVMIGAIGAVAAVFGMNFQIPFAHWGVTGFWVVIGVMSSAIVASVLVARARKWI